MKHLKLLVIVLILFTNILAKAQIRDESKVPAYTLPPLLEVSTGNPISTIDQWENIRRPQLLKIYEDNVYGQLPNDYDKLSYTVTHEDTLAMEGNAHLKQVAIKVSRKGKAITFNLILFIPKKAQGPVPVFLLINNRNISNTDPTRELKSGFWPAEMVINQGYAIAAIQTNEFAINSRKYYQDGALKLYPEQATAQNRIKGLGAWAWGASRTIDYFEKDPAIDAKKVALVGHSRGSKAALWAGANDKRFAFIFANGSGKGGAPLYKRKFGEPLQAVVDSFPYWFADSLRSYVNKEETMPFDSHMLMALIAPRPLYISNASNDWEADPKGAFLAQKKAEEVYALLGKGKMPVEELPPPGIPVIQSYLGHHIREGSHNLTLIDWSNFLAFAKYHFSTFPQVQHLVQGKGSGLTATYYNQVDFAGTTIIKKDSTVDFDWSNGAPLPSIGSDSFSVSWEGELEPKFSEAYTFNTVSDEGIRLWIDGKLIIDKWKAHTLTENTGNIVLEAGKKYKIKLEYYENKKEATAKLYWSSGSQAKEIIPVAYLYPSPPNANSTFYEAEEALLSKVAVEARDIGFTGKGYVNFTNTYANFIEWTIKVDTAGYYRLLFRYMNEKGKDGNLNFLLNDSLYSVNLLFQHTGALADWGAMTINAPLLVGINKIKLINSSYNNPLLMDHLQTRFIGPISDSIPIRLAEVPEENGSIKVYPVPSPEEITFLSKEAEIVRIRLFNSLGTTVLDTPVDNKKLVTLQVRQLTEGFYLAEILTTQGKFFIKKILVNK